MFLVVYQLISFDSKFVTLVWAVIIAGKWRVWHMLRTRHSLSICALLFLGHFFDTMTWVSGAVTFIVYYIKKGYVAHLRIATYVRKLRAVL